MTIDQYLFYLFALLTCGGAISVVICQNVVRMAFSLIISLASISALFFLLSADFVGATQLMVYVGGTIVLLIFGVMLTSSSALMQIRTSPAGPGRRINPMALIAPSRRLRRTPFSEGVEAAGPKLSMPSLLRV